MCYIHLVECVGIGRHRSCSSIYLSCVHVPTVRMLELNGSPPTYKLRESNDDEVDPSGVDYVVASAGMYSSSDQYSDPAYTRNGTWWLVGNEKDAIVAAARHR